MPATSKAQQAAAGMALAAKRGEMDPSELKGAAKEMYDSMSEDQLKDFAKGSTKGKPDHVEEGKADKMATKEKGGEWAKHLKKDGKRVANKKIRKSGKNIDESYDWIDNPDERMKRLNESLNVIEESLSTGEMNDLVKTLYKNVDLNIDDDFAIEMIIISADEFMGKRIDKKEAKKVLAMFDKKYPRFR